ncbi:MAG: tetratricopeptide repeat protein [Nitrosomonadaceae bacterium]
MNLKILGVLLPLTLVACAQIPTRTGGESSEQSKAGQLKLPVQRLTEPMLFDFLLGETALQRGESEIATGIYLRLARNTRDPRIAQRATEVALHSRQPAPALETAMLWVELDPSAMNARQTTAALLVSADRLEEARPHLERLLASEGNGIHEAFMQLNGLLARSADKPAILELVQHLSQPYPDLPEAHFAISQAAWFANQFDIALAEMKQALALRPNWETAAIYLGRILQRTSGNAAIEFYKEYLDNYPRYNDTRVAYARLLTAEKNYLQAREQFQKLLMENPANADIILAVGLLSMELRDYDAAEVNFKRVLELDYKDAGAVRFYLAGIYEKTQQIEAAMKWYLSVTSGNQYLPSQIRYAVLLAKQGKITEARQHLQQLPSTSDQQTTQLIIAEAQLLREKGADQEVFSVLSRGLEKLPNYPELLYEHALAADKIGKPEILERDLRKLIRLKPDHAHAYNALGYSFVEHNRRLTEALELIERASTLSPNDPYIMDSLGWVHYRMGDLHQGTDYLRRAFMVYPDPEIGAHLGEVLWAQDLKDEAREIWNSSLKSGPDNEALLKTIKKFIPQ